MQRTETSCFALATGLNATEVEMGKVKAWLMDMQEDALEMSRDAWIEKHGASNAAVFDEVQQNSDGCWAENVGSVTAAESKRFREAMDE